MYRDLHGIVTGHIATRRKSGSTFLVYDKHYAYAFWNLGTRVDRMCTFTRRIRYKYEANIIRSLFTYSCVLYDTPLLYGVRVCIICCVHAGPDVTSLSKS